MAAEKIFSQKFADLRTASGKVVIFHSIASIAPVEDKQPRSFFRFYQADLYFLQMFVRAFIIT